MTGADVGLGHPNRRRWPWIALAVGVAVALVAAVVLIIGPFGGSKGASSGREAVQKYLQALAAGDADTALSLGKNRPRSTDLLGADVLKAQLAKLPLTDVIVGDEHPTGADTSTVHVSVKLGQHPSEADLQTVRTGDGWKLTSAVARLSLTDVGAPARAILTVDGKPLPDGELAVFPGSIDLASSDTRISAATATPVLLDTLGADDATGVRVTMTVTDLGQAAVTDALKAAGHKCEESNELAPEGCPGLLKSSDFQPGTAQWSDVDTSNAHAGSIDTQTLTAPLNGTVAATVMARALLGNLKIGRVNYAMSGTADFSQTPLTLSFNYQG